MVSQVNLAIGQLVFQVIRRMAQKVQIIKTSIRKGLCALVAITSLKGSNTTPSIFGAAAAALKLKFLLLGL
jgi:hypothetical protein